MNSELKSYRIYVDKYKGYEYLESKNNLINVIGVLDYLLQEPVSKVIVIEHDILNNCDFPIFLFAGDYDEYINFRNSVLFPEENKALRKTR